MCSNHVIEVCLPICAKAGGFSVINPIARDVCVIKECMTVSCSTNGAIVGIIMMVCNAIVFASSFVCCCVPRVFILSCFPDTMYGINVATVLILHNKVEAERGHNAMKNDATIRFPHLGKNRLFSHCDPPSCAISAD